MTVYLVSNNGRSRLAQGVSAGATSLTLDENTGGRFPLPDAGQVFWVRIGSSALYELRLCTVRTGDVLTLDEPLDYDWPAKTAVILPINAELLQAFPQWAELGDAATRNVGAGAGDVAAGNSVAAAIAAHLTGDPHGMVAYFLDALASATFDAAKLTTGTIDIARLPVGALERMVTVANQSARFALTTATVQNGDSVRQGDTGAIYMVVDDTHLDTEDGYQVYAAGTAASVDWSGITGKPSNVTALAALNGAADKLAYFTGLGSMALAALTSYGRSVMATADDAALRTLLNLGGAALLNVGTTAGTVAAGNDPRFSSSGSGTAYSTSVVWDPASIAHGAQASTAVTISGASVGYFVQASCSLALSGLSLWGEVTASNTVTLYLRNTTGAAVDLASAIFYIKVTVRSDSNTVLLVNDWGFNGNTSFAAQELISGRTITAQGSAQATDAQQIFGLNTLRVGATNTSLAIVSDSTVFTFEGDFTIEGWIVPTTVANRVLLNFATQNWFLWFDASNHISFASNFGQNRITGAAVTLNTAGYFGLRRVNGVVELWWNGTMQGNWNSSTTVDGTGIVLGGDNVYTNDTIVGYIGPLRISNVAMDLSVIPSAAFPVPT